MATIIYSDCTRRFLAELDKQSKVAHNETDRHLRTTKQLKGVKRLYENDTSKFEPIYENREHLIKTLMPLVVKIAKNIAKRYGSRIEYDDCISSGLQGAIIATDRYIEKSAIEVQPAKLSTYAYAYIEKFVNEYCASVNTILSHGTTKWVDASSTYVMSGNQTYKEDGKSVEFFDIANDDNLTTLQHEVIADNETVDALSMQIFGSIKPIDKEILFMRFGVGSSNKEQLSIKDIADKLKCTQWYVETSIDSTIATLRELHSVNGFDAIIKQLSKSDLSSSVHWQRQLQ